MSSKKYAIFTAWNSRQMLGLTGVFGKERGKCGIIELCSDGGTGIRVRLKIEWRNPCGFDSRSDLLTPTKQGAE